MMWALLVPVAVAAPEPVERVEVGDQIRVGRTLRIDADEQAEDAISIGGDVVVDGEVTGRAISIGGEIRTDGDGVIVGDAIAVGGRIRSVEVLGDKITIAGPVLFAEPEPSAEDEYIGTVYEGFDFEALRSLYQHVIWLLVVSSASVLVSGLFPAHVRRVSEHVEAHPIRTAAIGLFTGGFVVLFSAMFTTLTLGLGLPISVLLLGALGVAWLLGVVALSQAIGSRIDLGRTTRTQWVAVLFGILTMGLLTFVPVLGTVVFLAASSIGVGAVMSAWFGGALPTTEVTQL